MDSCPNTGKPCSNVKNIHVIQNAEGEITEFDCCHECGSQLGVDPFTLMFSIVNSMLNPQSALKLNLQKLTIMEETLSSEDKCLGCGIGLDEIKKTGKMGCPNCYSTFKKQLEILLPQMHAGNTKHCGKKIKRPSSKSIIADLKRQMETVIKEEKYEEAAIIRDKIQELEKTINCNDVKSPEVGVEEDPV